MNANSFQENSLKKIVIVGGGTAGWMAAAAISKVTAPGQAEITLVESEQIGTVGVGEATIPQISLFNRTIGLDENEFMKATNATFKLGIEFVDWQKKGNSYIHPFGSYGTTFENLPFFHYWQKLQLQGKAGDISDYSLNIQACYQNRFMRPVDVKNSPLAQIAYAFHFDATLYAKFLRNYSTGKDVKRIEGIVEGVEQRPDDGFITAVKLNDGTRVEGDFFIDCTGFRGLLIEETLKAGYEDWSHYLPCDSAIAAPSEKLEELPPYTRATALSSGWQWRIPLQHRTGNGHVYSSKFISDDDARSEFLSNIQGDVLADPKVLRFKTGKRKKIWVKNCVAIGLSSGFLEPLESTSIHLIQECISKFLGLFPTKNYEPILAEKFNWQMDNAFEFVKDFLILHYHVTERNDSDFWNYCRTMEIPETLQKKMDLYTEGFRLYRDNEELFNETSWLAVMHGQGLKSQRYNSLADAVPDAELHKRVEGIKKVIDKCTTAIPLHSEFINKNCKSGM